MAIENFSTYTELDPDGDITVTSPKCDVSTMSTEKAAWVYADKDANHFGDFEHTFKIYLGSASNGGQVGLWGLSNNAHTIQDKVTAGSGMNVKLYRDGAGNYYIFLNDDGAGLNDSAVIAAAWTRYCTVKRAATALTLKIYTDAARTSLETTLDVVCVETLFQHIEAVQSRDSGGGPTITMSCYIEDLDLQEAPVPVPHSFGVIF